MGRRFILWITVILCIAVSMLTCACNSGGFDNRLRGLYNTGFADDGLKSVKVIGANCVACHDLYENAKQALDNMGFSLEIEFINNLTEAKKYDFTFTPAFYINDTLISEGKALTVDEIEEVFYELGF